MSSTAKQYTREIRQALNYNAIWLPSTPIDIGVIGRVEDDVFQPLDTITNARGITIQAEELPPSNSPIIRHQSQSGVSVQTKLSGTSSTAFSYLAKADAGVAVEFSQQSACVLSLKDCTTRRMAGQLAFRKELLRNLGTDWEYSFAVVTEVVLAASGTILVCQDSSGRVEISASADLGPTPVVDLGNAALGLQVANTEGKVFTIVGATGLTPLFRAIRVKETIFRNLVLGDLGDGDEAQLDAATMSDEQIDAAFEDL